MIYQNPQLLFGLFAIAIPIIIHLFNFRKHEKVYFSSIRFLDEVKLKNNKKRNIKNLLILACRIIAIAFLVLAFAKPYKPVNKEDKSIKNVFIYIDNSLSMDAISEKGRLLDIAKNKSEDIINSYESSSLFYLLTNNFSTNYPLNKEDITQKITELETNGNIRSIVEILNEKKLISKNRDHIYILSDLQEETIRINELLDTNDIIHIIPIQTTNNNNVSVDSVWIEGPILLKNRNQDIYLKVTNYDNTKKQIPITLEVNNKIKIKQLLNFTEKKEEEFKFSFNLDSNINICRVSIQDYPIVFDNELHFNLIRNNKIKVSSIVDFKQENYLLNLYRNDTINYDFEEKNSNNLNYQKLLNRDVIIVKENKELSSGLIETLYSFIKKGGSLVIIPPSDLSLPSHNNLLEKFNISPFLSKDTNAYLINKLHENHQLFESVFDGEIKNVELPEISYHYTQENVSKSIKQPIISIENNNQFLSHYNYDKGNIYLFNTPINTTVTNFKKHALFVPVFLNIANRSINPTLIYNTISSNNYFVSKDNNKGVFNLKNENIDIIPNCRSINGQTRYYTNNFIQKSGQYKLYDNQKIIDFIAYNYDSDESQLKNTSIEKIKNITNENIKLIEKNKDVSKFIKSTFSDIHYWKSCLIISLLFFGIEILLLKLIKT
ncbi:BatA domain-containing protein [Flavobacteriales bacterium]|nr:BatA domain-containing protein [Flavobacteriales bacterium]